MEIFLLFLLGLVFGSFVNVVVIRTNQITRNKNQAQVWKGILVGRSKCPQCKKQIEWYDNIPLLSFFLLRGKCRHCHKRISWQYPLVELATGLVWAASWMAFQKGVFPNWSNLSNWTNLGVSIVGITLLLGLLVSDLRYMTLPDEFMFPLFFLVAVVQVWSNWPNWTYLTNLAIAGVGGGLFFGLIWALTKGRGMGFGDVEYALVMGLILGIYKLLVGLVFAFVSGSLVGIILMFLGRKKLTSKLPFGPFLIIGTVIGIIYGEYVVYNYLGVV